MSVYNAFIALDGAIDGEVVRNEKMGRHTSLRVGGAADLFVSCNSFPALIRCIETLEEQDVRWVILGRGSNVLVADEGFRGCVVVLRGQFSSWQASSRLLTVASGVTLPRLVDATLSQSLSGLEAYVGIPGTVGGALASNIHPASVGGGSARFTTRGSAGSTAQRTTPDTSIMSLVQDLVVYRLGEGMHRYKASDIQDKEGASLLRDNEIVLEATFKLNFKSKDAIAQAMERRLIRRRAAQPLGMSACGFVFNDPLGSHSAQDLIESCDLKGYRIGGAEISAKHANFIVNNGGACAYDVVRLIRHVIDCVRGEYGIELETAVKFLGFTS